MGTDSIGITLSLAPGDCTYIRSRNPIDRGIVVNPCLYLVPGNCGVSMSGLGACATRKREHEHTDQANDEQLTHRASPPRVVPLLWTNCNRTGQIAPSAPAQWPSAPYPL